MCCDVQLLSVRLGNKISNILSEEKRLPEASEAVRTAGDHPVGTCTLYSTSGNTGFLRYVGSAKMAALRG